jgi:flagellar motor switch protein FliN/FliY
MADDQPPASDQAADTPPQETEPSAGSTGSETLSAASAEANVRAAESGAADAAAGAAVATEMSDADAAEQAAIDDLLKQASFEDVSAAGPAAGPHVGGTERAHHAAAADLAAAPFELPNFQQVMHDAQASSIELLRDVELNVKIELGRSRMLVEDVLKLTEGSVVELDKLAGDPVDVFVNDRLVARGEVLVLNDNFCVRVNEIVAGLKDEGS